MCAEVYGMEIRNDEVTTLYGANRTPTSLELQVPGNQIMTITLTGVAA